jgi:hypothetical protein
LVFEKPTVCAIFASIFRWFLRVFSALPAEVSRIAEKVVGKGRFFGGDGPQKLQPTAMDCNLKAHNRYLRRNPLLRSVLICERQQPWLPALPPGLVIARMNCVQSA